MDPVLKEHVMGIVIFVMKIFGFVEDALALEKYLAAKKKAKDIANMPTTKQERTDAANNGTL